MNTPHLTHSTSPNSSTPSTDLTPSTASSTPTLADPPLRTLIDRLTSRLEETPVPGVREISSEAAPTVEERRTLESREARLAYLLRPGSQSQSVDQALTLLRASFASSIPDHNTAVVIMQGLRMSFSALPGWVALEVVNRFVSGRVERRDNRFIPTSAEIAVEARSVLRPYEAERGDILKVLRAETYTLASKEERERIEAGFRELLGSFAKQGEEQKPKLKETPQAALERLKGEGGPLPGLSEEALNKMGVGHDHRSQDRQGAE